MALFDRNNDDRYRNRGGYDRDMSGGTWDRVERSFRGRDPNETGMRGGYGADYGTWGRGDMSPTEAGWRGGGTSRGGWNLGDRDRMDLGHHPRSGYDREMRGDDRNFLEKAGDSVRRGWNEMTGDDYDRGYRGRSPYDSGYGMSGGGMNPGAGGWTARGYGTDFDRGGRPGYSTYGRGIGNDPAYGRDRGYDRNYGYDGREYKSRQQTDAGDPFGDRQSRTPIRMVNEDYSDRLARRNAYDADVRRDRDWF